MYTEINLSIQELLFLNIRGLFIVADVAEQQSVHLLWLDLLVFDEILCKAQDNYALDWVSLSQYLRCFSLIFNYAIRQYVFNFCSFNYVIIVMFVYSSQQYIIRSGIIRSGIIINNNIIFISIIMSHHEWSSIIYHVHKKSIEKLTVLNWALTFLQMFKIANGILPFMQRGIS